MRYGNTRTEKREPPGSSLDRESWQVIGGLPRCHLPRHLSTHNADFAEQLEPGSVQVVQVLLAGQGFGPVRANDPCHWEFAATVIATSRFTSSVGVGPHPIVARRAERPSAHHIHGWLPETVRREFLCYEADDLAVESAHRGLTYQWCCLSRPLAPSVNPKCATSHIPRQRVAS